MPRQSYHALPLQNRTNARNQWMNDFTESNVEPNLPANLQHTCSLHVEHIGYSMQNCTYLLRHIDPAHAPLLHDLDLSFRSGWFPTSIQEGINTQTDGQQRRLTDWRAWFAANGVPESQAVSNVRNLNVSGQVYAGPDDTWSIFDIMLALLARMPRLRTIDLSISGLTRAPRPEVDFQTALPRFEEMEELTIGRSSLKFVHALLSRMGSRFKTLNIVGKLEPSVPREGPGTVDGHEDPGDRASVGSSSRAATSAYHMRPVDLFEVLQDLSKLSTASSGTGEPLRLNRLAIAPLSEPSYKKQAMRVAQAASLLITMPLLSRLHTLILDRHVFSCLCAYSNTYLSGNPLPLTVRNLGIVLTEWTLRESDEDVYGEGCTKVEQAFGYLGRQIERGEAKKLRRVKVMLHDTDYNGSRHVWESENGLWKEFAATCRRRRIGVHVDDAGSEE